VNYVRNYDSYVTILLQNWVNFVQVWFIRSGNYKIKKKAK